MSVKRYYWDRKSDCDCEIVEQPDGAMVDYDEHASVVAVLEARCAALAAEMSAIEAIHSDAVFITDEHYEQCPPEVQKMIRALAVLQIPAYQDFLAEVRASAVPEGYVLVPQQIFLEPSDIESICSQCGDGHESGYGYFTDGLLWVGNIQRDDGSIVHGLHISSADYSEEGGVTVCEFASQLRKGVQS